MNILITGASRGIGLEFVRQLSSPENRILAACRHPEEARELAELEGASQGRIRSVAVDVRNLSAPDVLAVEAARMGGVDLLINNAGIYPEGEAREDFEQGLLVNSIAPYLITRELLPILKKSKRPRAVFLTSLMGSIADNGSGGSVAYRASKAALNMMVRCLSLDEPWLTTVLMHPGWVKTRMGGPDALISTAESVKGMLRVVAGLKLEDSGSFLDYEGDSLPW